LHFKRKKGEGNTPGLLDILVCRKIGGEKPVRGKGRGGGTTRLDILACVGGNKREGEKKIFNGTKLAI